jgi:hypothetical protein
MMASCIDRDASAGLAPAANKARATAGRAGQFIESVETLELVVRI